MKRPQGFHLMVYAIHGMNWIPLYIDTQRMFAEKKQMKHISDWLDDRMQEVIDQPRFHIHKSDFQPQAKSLWLQAQAAGYSVAELREACGGDVKQFLLERRNAMTSVEGQPPG